MTFVDASIWIDYLNGKSTLKPDWLDTALGNEQIILGDLTLTEVLQGFKNDADFKTALALFQSFPIMDILGCALAIQSAKNYRTLRKKGITVRKTIDVMIATFCIQNRFLLLYDDKYFHPMVTHLKLKAAII